MKNELRLTPLVVWFERLRMEEDGMITEQRMKFFRRCNRGSRAGMRCASLVKSMLLLLAALVVLLLLLIGFFEGRKAYWDSQVRGMCEKDGGVVILEQMRITREQEAFLPHAGGVVSVAPESLSDPRAPAFIRTQETTIKDSQPIVKRLEHEVVRRHDGRRVAHAVIYLRSGGDIPSPAFASSLYCPSLDKVNFEISKTFTIEETKK